MKCLVCGEDTKYTDTGSFVRFHVNKYHKLSPKEYYDMFIKKENEGECLACGKDTKFYTTTVGYNRYCSGDCYKHSDDYAMAIKESFKRRDTKKEAEKRKITVKEKYGVDYVLQSEEIKIKSEKTNIKKYGVKSYLLTEDCTTKRWESLTTNKEEINKKRKAYWTVDNINSALDIRKQTCLNRYGAENVFMLDDIKFRIRRILEESGFWLSEENIIYFQQYRKMCNNYIKLLKDQIYDLWDGKDYYTGEDLIQLSNDWDGKGYMKYQPTIDHKISAHYGFYNNMSLEEINDINNMCVCSRSINSQKNKMCEEEFKKKLRDRGIII